jgi:CubicO group peptidase (beta-lactamase class C family)
MQIVFVLKGLLRMPFECHRVFAGPTSRLCMLAAVLVGCAWSLHSAAQSADGLEKVFRDQTDATLGTLVRDGRSSFGAAVLVKDGRTLLAPAYGVEDPSSKSPTSIDATVIDLNSLRKLFVAVALAQLVDRHVIASIDDPMNSYLRHFKLPRAEGREVTIRAVATHTAGFDQTEFGAGELESDPSRFFQQRFPGYVENAGIFSVYDSYGPELLAYLVSELTGQPFTRFVEDSILRPLAMNDTYLSTPAQPLAHRVVAFQPKNPANIRPGGVLKPVESAQIDGPAVSTMSDMAKFMIALLGPAAEQNVITPRMRELLFRIQQSNGAGGSAHGLLFDAIRSGAKTLFVHGGVGAGSKCMMALDIEPRTGIFYCYGDVRTRFDRDPAFLAPPFEQITDSMLKPLTACPVDEAVGCQHYPRAHWNEAWSPYLGLYVNAARHHHGFSRLRTIIYPTLARVVRSGDSIRLDGVDGFVEVSPGIFGSPQHLETFSFFRNESTGKTLLSVSDRPSVYERADSLLVDPRALALFLALLVLIALSGALLAAVPVRGISTKVRAAAASYGLVVGCGVAALFGLSAFGHRYFDGVSWPLNIVRVCAFLTIPACLFLVVNAVRADPWPRAPIARLGRLHYNVITASSIIMVAALLGVGLISFAQIT